MRYTPVPFHHGRCLQLSATAHALPRFALCHHLSGRTSRRSLMCASGWTSSCASELVRTRGRYTVRAPRTHARMCKPCRESLGPSRPAGSVDAKKKVRMDPREVAVGYLRSWFALDLLSALPFEAAADSIMHASPG